MTKLQTIGLVVVGIVVSVLFSTTVLKTETVEVKKDLGGVYNQVANYFIDGLYAGATNLFSVDSTGKKMTRGDVDFASVQQSFTGNTTATTTPCSILNPYEATVVVKGYMANITTGTANSFIFDVSTSSTAYGSSTRAFLRKTLPASFTGLTTWLPTTATSTNAASFIVPYDVGTGENLAYWASGEYLNFRIATTSIAPNTTLTGTCSVDVMKP